MSRIAITIQANHHPRYFHWGALLCNSLVKLGGVSPGDIYFTVGWECLNEHSESLGERCRVALFTLGVNVDFKPSTEIGKFRCVDDIFERFEDVSRVIQMDSDMALVEEMPDFSALMCLAAQTHATGFQMANFRQTIDRAGKLYHERQLDLSAHPFKPMAHDGNAQRRHRLLTQVAFGVEPEMVGLRCDGLAWLLGCVHVIGRELRDSPAWPSFLLLNTFCACDESVVMSWRAGSMDSSGYRFIDPSVMHLRTSPRLGFSLEPGSGLGLVHFSGDWFRLTPGTSSYIYDTLDRVLNSILS